jgi:peptidyl-prolyl cis-trans isomerase D
MIRFLQTPGPALKITLYTILLIICGSMVITLIPGGIGQLGLGSNPGQGVIATVSGEPITTIGVRQEAEQLLRRQFPRGNPQEAALLPYFSSQAANMLIMRQAVLNEARRMGLRATDQDVRDEIEHGIYSQTFFPNGKFVGEEQYQNILQSANLSAPQFEQNVKTDILLNKIRTLITGSVLVSDAEVRQEFEKQNTKVKFDYAVLRRDDLLKQIHPSESELKAFFESKKASYANSIPEKRKLRYALIDFAKIQSQVPVTQEDLQSYFNQHRDEFRVSEQVNARQILIKVPLPGPDGKVDANGLDAARKKADDVLKQLKSGAKFEDLAKKYSEDPSKENGGSVGWIQRGRFPSADVEKAAFSLPKGGTSDVINAGYAFVILHIDDKQEAHIKTLDEVKAQIEPIIRQQKASRAAENEATTLLTQARASGLEKAAASKGMQAITTDFVSRTDALPGIGNSPQFMDAVFRASEKAPPEQAQLTQGYAVFEVLGSKPPATPTFEEIHDRVESEFKNGRVNTLLAQKTQELSDRAKAEHDLKKAAKELGATVKTSDLVLPDGQVPDIGSMSGGASVAFTMKPAEISGPIENGNTGIVLALLEKQAPPEQEFEPKKDQIRDGLLQNRRQEMFGLFMSNLRASLEKSGKIKINQEEMKNLTQAQQGE